jgi:hypothetical protein
MNVRMCLLSHVQTFSSILSEAPLCYLWTTDQLEGRLTYPAPGLPFGGGGAGPTHSMNIGPVPSNPSTPLSVAVLCRTHP